MKILSFGEIMMRLTPPDYLTLEQAQQLNLSFVGTGVNLLSSLARFGHETTLLSKVPDNALGRAATATMRKLGIGDRLIGYTGNHMGSFFVEMGHGNRPTEVTYQNRLNGSFCTAPVASYDLKAAVGAVDAVHICGITLSLTDQTRETALALAKIAHEAGKFVCFDFNYRPSLNTQNDTQTMRAYYLEMLAYCDLVFGSARDLTDLLGFEKDDALSEKAQLEAFCKQLMAAYGVKQFAGTLRKGSGIDAELTGFYGVDGALHLTKPYTLTLLDRIGSGDAFAAGIINGHFKQWEHARTTEFATVASVLAHDTNGDVPMSSEVQIENYMKDPTATLMR